MGIPSSLVICCKRLDAWRRHVSISGWLSHTGLPMKTKSRKAGHSCRERVMYMSGYISYWRKSNKTLRQSSVNPRQSSTVVFIAKPLLYLSTYILTDSRHIKVCQILLFLLIVCTYLLMVPTLLTYWKPTYVSMWNQKIQVFILCTCKRLNSTHSLTAPLHK